MCDVAMPHLSQCFDDADIFYLANTLSTLELRSEVKWAELCGAVAKQFRGTEYANEYDDFPFQDYANACREAVEWQRVRQPRPQPAKGGVDVVELKARADIVAIIGQYTKLRKSGRNYVGCCPIHPDKHPSLTVYLDSQTWHCFGCGKGGDVFDFIQTNERCDFKQAVAILEGK